MKLAVMLLSCSDVPRVTNLDFNWVDQLMSYVAKYYHDQSGGQVNLAYRVFDWVQLLLTGKEWDGYGDQVGPVVKSYFEDTMKVDLSAYDHYALVIDKAGAALGAVSRSCPKYVHLAARDLNPALVQHELGHFFGADHANLDTPSGEAVYSDRFCIMGREGSKYSFVYKPLNLVNSDGTIDTRHSNSGPGMAAPALFASGWLDLAHHGIDISHQLLTGSRQAKIALPVLRGAPAAGSNSRPCAYADGVVPGYRLLLEYRSRTGWDQGLPLPDPGWVIAHLISLTDQNAGSLQIGVIQAKPGAAAMTLRGSVKVRVDAASASSVTLKS